MKRNELLMKKFTLLIFIFALSLLFGCTREDTAITSKQVLFTAATVYENSVATKTVYSDVIVNDKERIYWVDGDKIRIYSDKAKLGTQSYADYVVSVENQSPTANEVSLAPVSGNGLQWGDGENKFFCVYPSPEQNSDVSFQAENKVRFYIPSTQTYTKTGNKLQPNMDYAYMYDALTATQSSLTLRFKPMFSAFTFYIDSKEKETMTITSFTLSSASKSMAGYATATMSTSANSATTISYDVADENSKSLTLSFGSGITITKGSPIEITLLALPREYNDLTASFTTTEGTRSLKLQQYGSFITFNAGHKYKFKGFGLPGDGEWTYYISPIDNITLEGGELLSGASRPLQVQSYKTNGTTQSPVEWKLQALVGSQWVDYGTSSFPSWISSRSSNGDEGSGSGSVAGEVVDLLVAANAPSSAVPVSDVATSGNGAGMINTLRTNTLSPTTSSSSPRDLSLYDIYGIRYINGTNAVPSITKAGPHTANCYIVSAPGYYCFPLVYGNAINATKGNASAVYESAYYGNATYRFKNVNNNNITSPYIMQDLGYSTTDNLEAFVLWQDVLPGSEIINTSSISLIDAPTGAGINNCKYVLFNILESAIKPGNVIIALRDKIKKQILWSWHIWVTTTPRASGDDFAILPITYRSNNSNATATWSILACDLGWVPPLNYTSRTTTARSIRLRIKGVAGDGVAEFNVSQPSGNTSTHNGTYYTPLLYQWGRKDPFLPFHRTKQTNSYNQPYAITKPYSSSPEYTITTIDRYGNSNSAIPWRRMTTTAEWIANPHVMNGEIYSSDPMVQNAIPVSSQPNMWSWQVDYFNLEPLNPQYSQTIVTSSNGIKYYHSITTLPNKPQIPSAIENTVRKTIFDPTPAGFSIPFARIFSGFPNNIKYNLSGAKSNIANDTYPPYPAVAEAFAGEFRYTIFCEASAILSAMLIGNEKDAATARMRYLVGTSGSNAAIKIYAADLRYIGQGNAYKGSAPDNTYYRGHIRTNKNKTELGLEVDVPIYAPVIQENSTCTYFFFQSNGTSGGQPKGNCQYFYMFVGVDGGYPVRPMLEQ